MIYQKILHILQEYILLATGAPSSNALRDEVVNLYLGDLTQTSELVDAHMEAQARTNEKGVIGVVQAVANNGFGLNLSDQEAQQLVTDLNAQGIDSWSELFDYVTTELDESLSSILDNRSEAANRFTDLLAEQNKDSDYAGPQAKQAAQEWIAGIGASEESLVAANAVTLDLIDSFNEGNVQGRAFDGYIAGATVFIDENGDSKQSPGEVSTITDALGNFQFDGAVPSGKLVVKGGTDISTNQPFTSTLSAPLGSATLSPLSALANQLLQRGQAENIVAAEDILFHSLGIPRVDLSYFDPIKVGLDPTAGIEAHNAALQLHAATAQISNLLLVGSELIREVEGATGNTMQSMTRALLGRMIEAEENGETIDLSDTQVLTGIIQTGVENSNITSNTDVPVGHVATVLSEINTITQAAAENNNNTNMQTALSNIVKLQTIVQSQLMPEAVEALKADELSIIVDEFMGDELIDRVDEEPAGTLNETTPVNDGNALTNRPTEPTTPQDSLTLTSSLPADNATAIAIGSNIVLTFNEDVVAGTGSIVISDGAGDARTIEVTDATQISISGNTVTINPATDLNLNTTYNVQMASGVITDTEENPYAGISDATTLNFSTPDTLAPTLSSSIPADDATAVTADSNITLTFNENVAAGIGNIVISDGTDTRTIAVGDAQVSFSGNTVTINPTTNLNPNTTYNVQMASGVITDTAGNAYAGISDTTTLNFDIPGFGSGLSEPPILVSSTPVDETTAVVVGSNITLTFNKSVAAGTGNIVISDGAGDTRTIAVTDATQISFSGSTVTINPTTDLNPNTTYSIQMAAGVITDTAGNAHIGINNATTLNFSTTDALVPTLSSSNPVDDATAVAVGSNLVLTFNEDVVAGTGNIVISDGAGDTRTIAVGDAQVSFSGNTVTINPTADLNPNATYNVQMASGVINDTDGNAYAGISDAITLNFSTPDALVPTLSSSNPADGATVNAINSNLVLTFSENVAAGTGNIVISDGAGDTRTIAVGDAQVSFSGNTVTINPTADLNPNATYNVQMASGVIIDTAGNAYAGINDTTTLNFSTPDGVITALSLSNPVDNANAVAVGSNIILIFNEDVVAGTGNIVISDGTNDTRAIAVGDAQVDFSGNTVTINPVADLNPNTTYHVQMASGVITDTAGNAYTGISGTTTLNFSTTDTLAPTLSSSNPVDDATAVAVGSNIVLNFNEDVAAGTGNIVISDGTDTRIIPVDDAQVSFSDNTVTIDLDSILNLNTTYHVEMASGVITDMVGNAYAGISDTTTLNFSTPVTVVELSAIEDNNNDGGFVINGSNPYDASGREIGSAGDVNGDGLEDLIVGALGSDVHGGNSGASYVVFGKANGSAVELSSVEIGASGGFAINGVTSGDSSGTSVSSAGDVNGDGLSDLLIGASGVDTNGPSTGAGYVVFGKSSGASIDLTEIENGNGGFVMRGAPGSHNSGYSVDTVGDVNGDGLSDMIIGAFGDDTNAENSGASFVVFGKTNGAVIELSDVKDGTGGFVINGLSPADYSGFSVSGAGDVNGDGLADVIVGAFHDDPNNMSNSGSSHVVFGKTSGAAIEVSDIDAGTGGFVINGVSASDYSSISVSEAGDVNGDGLADLIVGAFQDDPNGAYNSGASFVVFGKTNGTAVELCDVEAGTGGFVINGASNGDFSGRAVSSAGDVNGDGLDDLIVGAIRSDPNGTSSGASYVVFGKASGTTVDLSDIESNGGTVGFVINGVSGGDISGRAVSSAGDVNGDGFSDLIVGAYRDDPRGDESGASFVIFGGQNSSAIVGSSGDGDLTGDGGANQLVGGAGNDTLIGRGGADVLRGGTGNDILEVSDLNFASLDGGTGTDTLRFDDVLNVDLGIIANSRLKSLEIIDLNNTGSSLRLATDDILTIVGDEASNELRINGGNTDSLVLKDAAFFDTATSETIDAINYQIYRPVTTLGLDESVRLLVQQSIAVSGTFEPVELSDIEQNSNNLGFVINGVSANDFSGRSVSAAGDVNGDGLADLIVGAVLDSPNDNVRSGASFVVFGKSNGAVIELSEVEAGTGGGFVINGASASHYSGDTVSTAGDVNGDGLADLIVGAFGDNTRGGVSGASFVVFGKTTNTAINLSEIRDGTGGFVINGASAGDQSSRHSVSNAGDVNGDGLADLIVGAREDDPNGDSSGASFVVFGKTSGTNIELSAIEQNSNNDGFVINGVSAGDNSGYSVSTAGDVNGDGLADLIVGARYDDPNGNDSSGASFVVFGKRNGAVIELSDVEAGTGGFVINGVTADDHSGHSVSTAGDVNGDGLADLIVGAHRFSTNSGASFVVFGKTNSTAINLTEIEAGIGGFVINGADLGDYSGRSVSTAGDVNGDGLADLIVGAPLDDPNGDSSGAAFVVFGKTDGAAVEIAAIDNGTGGFGIHGVNGGDSLGSTVSSAGDVNGDGFSDLIVGAYGDDPNGLASGASFVVFGGQGSLAVVGTNESDTLTGTGGADQLVAGADDDILIGNGGADVLRGGAGDDILDISDLNFVSLDGGAGVDTLRFNTLLNIDLNSIANSRLSSLEIIDLNDTGSSLTLATDDILTIVGDEARNELRINGGNNNGNTDSLDLSKTAFYNSSLTETINTTTYNIYLPRISLGLDESVRLLVQQNISVTGAAAAITAPVELSSIEQNSNNGGFVIHGIDAGDLSGFSVSGAGDVNGDGLDDVIIGAYSDDPNAIDSGASFVVFGKTDGIVVELSAVESSANAGGFVINGAGSGDHSGRSVSSAGDVNGDGLADLIVGAQYDDPGGNSDSGAGFVVFGKADGIAVELSAIENNGNLDGFVINGISTDDHNGHSVSNAGDVNGDGLDDLIVGAVGYDANGDSNSGGSFVVFGKSTGTTIDLSAVEAGTGGFAIKGESVNDYNGSSVSGAGDVNGDGLADLIVGASGVDPNGERSGASFVVFGKTNTTAIELSAVEDGTGGFVINGVSADDRSGESVSSAGDVNGDGLADLIVGAYYDDPNGSSNSGASFVVFGKTDGTAIELSAVESDGDARGFVIDGFSTGDHSGHSVSNAGDLNGDGLADLIIGAYGDDPNGDGSGAKFVVFGQTSGEAVELSDVELGEHGFVIHGADPGDESGFTVSGAGDVNGDGFSDLIVGANRDDSNGNTDSGASFVIFGGQGNTATVGTSGNDTLIGSDRANQLIGGAGNDTLVGHGGPDVLRGGAGDDILEVMGTFVSLDGGTGTDTLRIDAPIILDLRALPDSMLTNIEIIDLTQDNGPSTVSLNITELLNLSETQTAADPLVIHADVGDTINLYNNSNGQAGSWTHAGSGAYEFSVGGIGVIGAVTVDEAATVDIF